MNKYMCFSPNFILLYQVAFKDTISMHFAFEIVFELLRHNTKQAFIFGYFLYECNLVLKNYR